MDLSAGIRTGAAVKAAAFSQITRCLNCSESYSKHGESAQCAFDARADAGYSVPCCFTPREQFDYMGMSVRTDEWRYTECVNSPHLLNMLHARSAYISVHACVALAVAP